MTTDFFFSFPPLFCSYNPLTSTHCAAVPAWYPAGMFARPQASWVDALDPQLIPHLVHHLMHKIINPKST